jgi:hypothetical protein
MRYVKIKLMMFLRHGMNCTNAGKLDLRTLERLVPSFLGYGDAYGNSLDNRVSLFTQLTSST